MLQCFAALQCVFVECVVVCCSVLLRCSVFSSPKTLAVHVDNETDMCVCSFACMHGSFQVFRALLSVCRALLGVCRALLSVCRVLLRVCRALLRVFRALSNTCHALLSVYMSAGHAV